VASEEPEEEEEEKPKKMVASSKAATPKPAPAVAKKPMVAKKEAWDVPDDNQLHPWTFRGKKYLRMYSGEIYESDESNGMGAWAGMWDAKAQKIDDSVEEPTYEDEE
jgi:hypothetical protein